MTSLWSQSVVYQTVLLADTPRTTDVEVDFADGKHVVVLRDETEQRPESVTSEFR